MYTYIAIQTPEFIVHSIVEFADFNTMDGLEFPDNVTMFLSGANYDTLPQIGQVYNPETNKFE